MATMMRQKIRKAHENWTHELSTNTARAGPLWKEVVFGGTAVKVQTEERNGLLFETPHSRRLGSISGDHAEVVREDSGLAGLVREEVVGDRATRYELEGAIRILEVQLGKPVCGLVLLDTSGSTFRFTEVVRGGDLDSKVGTTNDPVDVTGDTARVHDRVSAFNRENVLYWRRLNRRSAKGWCSKSLTANEEVSPCGRHEGEQDERRECDHRYR